MNVVVGAVTAKAAKGTGGPSGDECQNLVAQTVTAEMYRSGGATAGNNPGVRNVVSHTLRENWRNNSNPASEPLVFQGAQTGVREYPTAGSLRADAPGSQPCGSLINATVPRRLTPTECERLQGFPDGWTVVPDRKSKRAKRIVADSPRYRALGNAVAVPCVEWIMHRIAHHYGTGPVIDLFSGIGGFALAAGGAGFATAWFSEIEPFACKVLGARFPGVPNRGDVREVLA